MYCVFVSMCQVWAGPHRGQKRALDPLKLELHTVVSHTVWVLETKLWSSVRAASTHNRWAISPAQDFFLLRQGSNRSPIGLDFGM